MPSSPKLKVFRTPIGFHDAYVAAPSQKAALEAWGSDSNLFAQKSAELVTDPALTAEPLANPGIVIKRLRGTAAEQIAALPPDAVKVRKQQPVESEQGEPAKSKPQRREPPVKTTPRPDRGMLASAEQALEEATERHRAEQKALRDREAALQRERRATELAHRQELEALEETRMRAEASYDKAMKRWRA